MIVMRKPLQGLPGRKTNSRSWPNNINAVFPSGVAVALLGRLNGAGKSTLLQMIAGNTSPTSARS